MLAEASLELVDALAEISACGLYIAARSQFVWLVYGVGTLGS